MFDLFLLQEENWKRPTQYSNKNRDACLVCRTMLYAMCKGLLLLSASQSVLLYWACMSML